MKKINSKIKRKLRNRKKLKDVNTNKLRITVFKSLKNISAQIIDDNKSKTLVSASSTEKELKKTKSKKMDLSNILGELLAKRAKEKKISSVYFDRGGYKYHGRIKALAESLRKNGLKI
jgi:ribosomal protein L18, bacterial type